tara:strand:+ start:4072 stop:4539 length:468 start_codon:yes stop_codon:yes gene_type:complete
MDTEEFSDACMALCNAERLFDPERGFQFSTYAYVSAQREILKSNKVRLRKHFHHVDETDYLNKPDHRTPSPEDTIDSRWESKIIKQVIEDSDLDERSRSILILRVGYGWQLKKLGDKYGISKERVRQILEATIKKVRDTAMTKDGDLIEQYAKVT